VAGEDVPSGALEQVQRGVKRSQEDQRVGVPVQPNPAPVGSSKDLCRPQHPRLRTIATLEHDLVALDHDQNDDIAFAAKWTTSFCRGDMC
jgi:hypothetical protein